MKPIITLCNMQRIQPRYQILLLFVLFTISSFSQQRLEGRPQSGREEGPDQEQQQKGTFIKPDVRAWHLKDGFTHADTTAVDTMTTGFQIYNPIYKKSIANAYLGNINTAYQAMIFEDREVKYGNLFFNSYLAYLPDAKDLYFYNTKTPYVNITYNFGGPKRRSEEAIKVLYTQNVNKKFNVGASYSLSSSLGQYSSQKSDVDNAKFFTSYDGDKYSFQAAFLYSKLKNLENGGIDKDAQSQDFNKLDPDGVVVRFTTAEKVLTNRKLFFNQSFDIGNITLTDKDSVQTVLPVGTAFHTLEFEQDQMQYNISNLPSYYGSSVSNPFYPNINSDTLQTADSVRINTLRNTVQIRFNEEANSLFKFGLRAYITNEVSFYRSPKQPVKYTENNGDYIPHYINNDTTLVNTALGGQIFKNLGENFWWNAGIKLYFQGYRAGDSEITGDLNSSFRILKDTAGFFANGGIYLTQPELFESQYYSNHLAWNNNFGQKKTIRFKGGIRIPTKQLELSAGGSLMNNYIYWTSDGTPSQSSGVIQVFHGNLKKMFKLANIRINNDLAFQYSSNQNIIPLPTLAYYNSTYYQNTLFQVLHFQIGFDFRYFTKYYAPFYMPASGQFTIQNEEKVGDYPWVDVFLNFQLKRARVYVKYDHVNQGYPDQPYYTTLNYPGNPRALKFGVSWNFYD
nr:putative porin [uncultured Carboxylicivirga sp.]